MHALGIFCNIYLQPESNGMTLFILGVLFILSAYHFLLYFQHKDKAYLFYSLYTFAIFFRQCFVTEVGFMTQLVEPWKPFFLANTLNDSIVWLYNCLYFVFVFAFLDYKHVNPKRYKWLNGTIVMLIVSALVFQLLTIVTGNPGIVTGGYYFFFMPIVIVTALFSFYAIREVKTPIRKYIILGSIVLFVTSLLTEFAGVLAPDTIYDESKYLYFYAGIIIENLFFSLGLGQKQKLILQQRNESQLQLIQQYEENDGLRDALNEKLKQEVVSLEEITKQQEIKRLKAEFEQQLAELKLASLQSQMNPHFIFNSLNSIKLFIIKNDTEKAVGYLNTFAKLMRKILAASRERSITLAEELETAKLYAEIENIRFENQIAVSIEIDPRVPVDGISVPPLILQPFIENAIWHGLAPKETDKHLQIHVEGSPNDSVTIRVVDNGIGRSKAGELKHKRSLNKGSVGMSITEERMQRFTKDFDGKFSLAVNDLTGPDGALGTEVILTIPYE